MCAHVHRVCVSTCVRVRMQANAHACHTLIVSCAGPQKSTGDVKAQQQIGCNLCAFIMCVRECREAGAAHTCGSNTC